MILVVNNLKKKVLKWVVLMNCLACTEYTMYTIHVQYTLCSLHYKPYCVHIMCTLIFFDSFFF